MGAIRPGSAGFVKPLGFPPVPIGFPQGGAITPYSLRGCLLVFYPGEGLGAIPLGEGHPNVSLGDSGGIFPRYTGG
ncbi:hypothetical protein FBPa29_0056 [Pseudomonas phage vB_PaeP_FBPa29]|nr:hypothetical protein FBPa29_0056 [Pseudomonas phage vB_PaeP_FBPa29]